MVWLVPLFAVNTVVLAAGQLLVTAEVPIGFEVLQVAVIGQELDPLAIVQLCVERESVPVICVNEAVTVQAAVIAPVEYVLPKIEPLQVPPHPVKVEPVAGAAVSTTKVLGLYGTEQVVPQFIFVCAGAEIPVTVPEPVPGLVTVRS